jgi:hypothetical protein
MERANASRRAECASCSIMLMSSQRGNASLQGNILFDLDYIGLALYNQALKWQFHTQISIF